MRMHKGARRRRKAGFTLVELLVTIVLIGIISIATFAVFISSLNTFGKQKEVLTALELKDLVMETVKAEVSKSLKIALADDFMSGPKIKVMVKDDTAPNGEREELRNEVILYPDGGQPHLTDNKVTDYNFIYSNEGRIYIVERNIDGRVNYNTATNQPTAYPTPQDGVMYGNAEPLLDDRLYDKYMVDMTFKSLNPVDEEVKLEDGTKVIYHRYYTMQIVVRISTKATAEKPSEEVARGVETIVLDNVYHGKRGILFRNTSTVEWDATHLAKAGTFKYCYYAKMTR